MLPQARMVFDVKISASSVCGENRQVSSGSQGRIDETALTCGNYTRFADVVTILRNSLVFNSRPGYTYTVYAGQKWWALLYADNINSLRFVRRLQTIVKLSFAEVTCRAWCCCQNVMNRLKTSAHHSIFRECQQCQRYAKNCQRF